MADHPDLAGELALALELADLADGITLPRFRAADLAVETKPDLTPVSEADRAVEDAVRSHLAGCRPQHAVVGEERGAAGDSAWRWIVDPIDGTKNYVRGIPVWASLIALQHDADVVLGVVSAPALGRRWWAARGHGAHADGHPIRVSKVRDLADAQLSLAGYRAWHERGFGDRLHGLMTSVWRTRGFGDFWQHVLVAEGAVDVALEPELALWDTAALIPIVEEAGGRLTDLEGRPWTDGSPCITTNGVLHDAVLGAFRPPTG